MAAMETVVQERRQTFRFLHRISAKGQISKINSRATMDLHHNNLKEVTGAHQIRHEAMKVLDMEALTRAAAIQAVAVVVPAVMETTNVSLYPLLRSYCFES